MNNNELYTAAIANWGEDFQINQAIEEAAEFIEAYYKGHYEHDTPHHIAKGKIIEETADLIIMCEQLKIIFGEDSVNLQIEVLSGQQASFSPADVARLISLLNQYRRGRVSQEKVARSIATVLLICYDVRDKVGRQAVNGIINKKLSRLTLLLNEINKNQILSNSK